MEKAGFVTIIGNPNVGKSTFLNNIIGENISIISDKAQTTRHRLLGILNGDDYQVIFTDTPGIINTKYELQNAMMNFVKNSLQDSDLIIYMVGSEKKDILNEKIQGLIKNSKIKLFLVINKVDLMTQEEVKAAIDYWKKKYHPHTTIPISALNKYNFIYKNKILTLTKDNNELLSISSDDEKERLLLSKKLTELESSLIKPITLLKNKEFPFFDTSSSKNIFNSVSLINLNSIRDFEIKINEKVELQRFRANFYVDGIDAWEERNWLGKIIKINNVSFKVEKNIPRCVAINLKPKTDDNSLNLLTSLKKTYNHFDMGIYLTALNDGKIELENKIEI